MSSLNSACTISQYLVNHTNIARNCCENHCASVSVGVVVSIPALFARGVGFDPRLCHHASAWDVLIVTSVGSGLQTKEVKMGTGSVQINPQPAARIGLHWPGDCIT